jgi:Leucine-rich repeat (LRR) protein
MVAFIARRLRALLLVFVCGFASALASVTAATVPSSERAVLVALYNSANGSGWFNNTNWNTSADVCTWYGVTCTATGANVASIDLQSNRLEGTLPSTLNQLTELVVLQLFRNQLGGSIPSLAGLTKLEFFSLFDNFFEGSIPSLAGLTRPWSFQVGFNYLSGVIPEPPSPSALRVGSSNLCRNGLTAVTSPAWNTATGSTPWSANCAPQQTLTFDTPPRLQAGATGNALVTVSPYPGSLSGVQYFSLTPSNCTVDNGTGLITVSSFPVAGNTCTIRAEKSGDDTFNAAIPVQQSITILPATPTIRATERAVLIELYKNTNGAGWHDRTNWRNATDTDFAGVGTECTWYGVTCNAGNANVVEFNLSQNNLVGTLPATLNQLTALEVFEGSQNQLVGSIPSLSGLTALQSFRAGYNQLTGTIPSLSGLSALQVFLANNNELTGTIPSLSGLSALQVFLASNNQLTGSIPSLSGLTDLRDFAAENNQLSGTISSLSGLSALQRFRVDNNQLTGPIPAVPAPTNALRLGRSPLCPNQLDVSVDADWDAAAGSTPWSAGCTAATPPLTPQTLGFPGGGLTLFAGGTATVSAYALPFPGSTAPTRYTSLTPQTCTVGETSGVVVAFATGAALGTTLDRQCIIAANKANDTTYTSAPQITRTINVVREVPAGCLIDVDGDGKLDASTDGLLLLRYMLGFRGNALIAGISMRGSRYNAALLTSFLGAQNFNVSSTALPAPPATALRDGLTMLRNYNGATGDKLLGGTGINANDSDSVRTRIAGWCAQN